MEEKEEYSRLKTIFSESGFGDVEFNAKRGKRFLFPIYMDKRMELEPVESLDLSIRSVNCLRRAGIGTIGALCIMIHDGGKLGSIRNCGRVSIVEIMDKLFEYHYLRLKENERAAYLKEVIRYNLMD